MKPAHFIFVFVLLPVGLLTGCHRSHARERIVAIPKSSSDWLYRPEQAGMAEAADHANLDLYWNGFENGDVQRQIELVESAVRNRSYGVAITPGTRFSVNGAIGDALAHRIPVVVLFNPVPIAPSPHLSFVLEDVKAGADLAAQRLNKILNGSGHVAFLGINPRDPQTVDRSDAMVEALQRIAPGIHLDERVVNSQSYGSMGSTVGRLLQEHPDLDAIVAMHNFAGLAAAGALRSPRAGHKVRLIVFDQNLGLLYLLRQHKVDSIVVQNLQAIGAAAVRNIVADRRGEAVPTVTYFQPQLVTPENIDDEAIQNMLRLSWERP